MRIRRVRLIGVKAFILPFDREIFDSWNDTIPEVSLVFGPNGGGKTTLLETLADLWDLFGRLGNAKTTAHERVVMKRFLTLSNGLFAGIQVADLFPQIQEPIWFIVARKQFFEEFKAEIGDKPYIAVLGYPGGKCVIQTPNHDRSLFNRLGDFRERCMAGIEKGFPNVVHIPSEGRVIRISGMGASIPTVPPERYWLARYEEKSADVESMLYSLKFREPDAFERILENINRFLTGKRVTGFNKDNVLEVQRPNNEMAIPHSIGELASGEKQIIALLAFADRWLREGGVLLVDEPDLHLHPSVTMQLVDALRQIVKQRNGQMFFTSHSPEVWKEFSREEELINLGKDRSDIYTPMRKEDTSHE